MGRMLINNNDKHMLREQNTSHVLQLHKSVKSDGVKYFGFNSLVHKKFPPSGSCLI